MVTVLAEDEVAPEIEAKREFSTGEAVPRDLVQIMSSMERRAVHIPSWAWPGHDDASTEPIDTDEF